MATLPVDLGNRQACTRLGRCLWGCPRQALYTPALTLRQLQARAGFEYRGGTEALRFRYNADGDVTALEGRHVATGESVVIPVRRLALAAGTLATAALLLRSVAAATGEQLELGGLMDNRQVLVPFVNARMFGRPYDPATYQYHLLGMGLTMPDPKHYVHAQITTLKSALMHPIVQQLPFDLRTSWRIARRAHAALGVVNVNFHDDRREKNRLSLEQADRANARLVIRYTPDPNEPARLHAALARVRGALWQLGCFVPPGMQHVRPMGASVHYAGTLPMSTAAASGQWTTDEAGRSRAFKNVVMADGSTFPFLPAKNLTFTLMANATRVANATL